MINFRKYKAKAECVEHPEGDWVRAADVVEAVQRAYDAGVVAGRQQYHDEIEATKVVRGQDVFAQVQVDAVQLGGPDATP